MKLWNQGEGEGVRCCADPVSILGLDWDCVGDSTGDNLGTTLGQYWHNVGSQYCPNITPLSKTILCQCREPILAQYCVGLACCLGSDLSGV